MIVAFGAQIVSERSVRLNAAGKIGVTAPHQYKIATKASVLIERAGGFHRSVKFVVGPYQR